MRPNCSTSLRSNLTGSIEKRRSGLRAALCGLALGCAALPLLAADSNPPKGMTYQGYLTDGSGNPLGNANPANYDVVFRIFDASSAGNIKWAEKQTVTIDKGQFSVVLGEGAVNGSDPRPNLDTVFSAPDASDRFIDITVKVGAADVNIAPRLRLVTSPFAFLAKHATSLVGGDGGTLLASTAPNQLTVNGTLNATTFSGSGASLSGLDAGSITSGTLADARLSPNVPLLSGGKIPDSAIPDPMSGRTFNSAMGITGGNTFEFGVGTSKEVNNGKIGYRTFTSGLDIVGAGTAPDASDRRITFHAQGGSYFVGNVGIGTPSPTAPLDVRGFANQNRAFAYYARSIGAFGIPFANTGVASGIVDYSIVADHRMGASEFNAFSDARIKDVVGLSDGAKDLEIIRQLRVKDYYSVDKIAEGNSLKKGFIAQEVQTLIPQAVTASKRFVPDIYSLPVAFEHDAANQQLTITLPKAHRAKEGDRIQIFADQSRLELSVARVISPEKFVLEKCQSKPAQMFVFGKEVPDFLTLNYDRIFTTGISAMQELARRLEMVEAREKRITALEEKVSRLEALEQEVTALKKQLAAQARASERIDAQFQALNGLVKRLASAQSSLPDLSAVTAAR